MRIRRRSDRRASLTRRIGIVLLLGLLAAVIPVLHPEPVSAASGVDDYPSRLKNARQDSLVDPWQFYNRECTSFVAWRLNSENGVAFNDYWRGQHWGNASNWSNAARSPRASRSTTTRPVAPSPGGRPARPARRSATSPGCRPSATARSRSRSTTTSTPASTTPAPSRARARCGRAASSTSRTPSPQHRVARRSPARRRSGKKLTTTRGTWSAKSLAFNYQWLANGKPIEGATKQDVHPDGRPGRASRSGPRSPPPSPAPTRARRQPAATDAVAKGVFVNTTATRPSRARPRSACQLAPSPARGARPAPSPTSGTPAAPDRRRHRRHLHPDRRPAGQADQGEGHLERARLHDAASCPPVTARRRPGSVHGHDAADDLRRRPGRPAAHRDARRLDPAGQDQLQWLADGTPIAGATGTATPRRPTTCASRSRSRSPCTSAGTTTPSRPRPPPRRSRPARSSTPGSRPSSAPPRWACR